MPVRDRVLAPVAAQFHEGGIELVEQWAAPWRELCRTAEPATPFVRPEWIAAYLGAFAPHARLLLAVAQQEDRWQALLPLLRERTWFCGLPVRMLRGAANAHSVRFHLLRAAGEPGAAGVRRIWQLLAPRNDWDVIELPYVPENSGADLLLECAAAAGCRTGRYESIRSPYILLDPATAPAAIPHSAHFRQNLRRRMRKAQAAFDVRLRRIDQADAAELARFYDLEASGWKGQGRTAIRSAAPTRRFYDEIAAAAARQGYFSLYLLEFDGKLVAGHFGITYDGVYYSPKVAYDESYAAYGPGHLIVEAILQDLLGRGCREFDFAGPWMDWKQEWTHTGRRHDFCYIFRPGSYGRLLHLAKFRLMASLRAAARRARAFRR